MTAIFSWKTVWACYVLLIDEVDEELGRRYREMNREAQQCPWPPDELAAPCLEGAWRTSVQKKYPKCRTDMFIRSVNDFFGERITVAGLLTGQDLMEQLTGQESGRAAASSEQHC